MTFAVRAWRWIEHAVRIQLMYLTRELLCLACIAVCWFTLGMAQSCWQIAVTGSVALLAPSSGDAASSSLELIGIGGLNNRTFRVSKAKIQNTKHFNFVHSTSVSTDSAVHVRGPARPAQRRRLNICLFDMSHVRSVLLPCWMTVRDYYCAYSRTISSCFEYLQCS